MPGYNVNPKSVGGQKGILVKVRAAETPASGAGGASASQAVALPETYILRKRPFSVAGVFAGNPGAFQDEVQVADVDVENGYQTIAGGVINTIELSGDGVTYTYRMDVPENTASFARILCRTQNANAAAETVTIKPC